MVGLQTNTRLRCSKLSFEVFRWTQLTGICDLVEQTAMRVTFFSRSCTFFVSKHCSESCGPLYFERQEVDCSSFTNTWPILISNDSITIYVPRAFQWERKIPNSACWFFLYRTWKKNVTLIAFFAILLHEVANFSELQLIAKWNPGTVMMWFEHSFVWQDSGI